MCGLPSTRGQTMREQQHYRLHFFHSRALSAQYEGDKVAAHPAVVEDPWGKSSSRLPQVLISNTVTQASCLLVLGEERFAFLAEWYDPNAALLRRYQLLFYPRDGSVEMYDVKNQRAFLRRTKYDDLHQEDLFVGNRVNVFSRQLNLIDYGDHYTANKLGSKKERTLAMIKPDAVTKVGDIIQMIYDAGLIVTKAKMTKLSWKQAGDFYMEHQSKSFFNNLVQVVTSGPVVVMELMGDEAVSVWRKVLGPTDPGAARVDNPASLRARFGTDGTSNAGHGSDSLASAARELELFFPSTTGHGPPNTAQYSDCTCCIIKPHAISEALTGKILNSITEAGFEISALQMFNLDQANAEEFLEVYKGVVAEYTGMVAELCSGPCMALEIHGTDAPRAFRAFCGPTDPVPA
ncbi:nucleoside diphosphate kinase homolog 7 isoform X5 [Brachyhypopomus gauderio]|uniref:nucleoside diphosphate kinase homolog 7 isoform X5 n=1 Tax=Brachyhypopomus gauderio TaxID=698409 RepID=UPI004041343C